MIASGIPEKDFKPKRIRRLLGIAITCIAVAYFAAYFLENFAGLAALELRDGAAIYLIGAAALLTIVPVTSAGLAWWLLLRASKVDLGLTSAVWILAFTQIAKYLPGNFAHHIGRVELAADFGVERRKTAWTLLLEAVLIIVAGFVAVTLAISIIGPDLLKPAGVSLGSTRISVLPLLVASAVVVFWFIVNVWRPPTLQRFLGSWRLARPSIVVVLACIALYLLNGFVTAAVLVGLQSSLLGDHSISVWMMFGAWTIAWLVGFVTPGAPAGLGIREALLVGMLSPFMSPGGVLALTLWQRLLTTVAEGLMFGLAFLVRVRFAMRQKVNRVAATTPPDPRIDESA